MPAATTKRRPPGVARHPLDPTVMEDLVRAAWYGDPGYGKTSAMATLANVGPVVFLDPEQRLKRTALKRLGINVENIERITDCRYESLKRLFEAIGNRVSDGEHFAGVLWDANTEQQRVFTQELVDAAVKVAADKGYVRPEIRTQREDYGDATEEFRRLMRTLYRIHCHIGVTCLARRDKDEEEKIRVTLDLTNAFRRDFVAAMDIILYMQMEPVGNKIERAGLCVPLGRFEAKDTFSVLPRRLVNPTFERVLGYVNGSLTARNDSEQAAAKAARESTQEKDK